MLNQVKLHRGIYGIELLNSIIADEMQNATKSQMKMLLTHADGAKMIVTDLKQHDRDFQRISDFIELVKNYETSNLKHGVSRFDMMDVEHPAVTGS